MTPVERLNNAWRNAKVGEHAILEGLSADGLIVQPRPEGGCPVDAKGNRDYGNPTLNGVMARVRDSSE